MAHIRLLSLLLLIVYPTYIRGDDNDERAIKTVDEKIKATEKEIKELKLEFGEFISMIKVMMKTLEKQEKKIDELEALYQTLEGKDLDVAGGATVDEESETTPFRPRTCAEIFDGKASGVFHIYPNKTIPVVAKCARSKGGGWTVIQKRFDGSVNFYRGWEKYARGFGDPKGEHWLGLRPIHVLTQTQPMELYVGMTGYDGSFTYAKYSSFSVSSEEDNFRLSVSGYSGTAGDRLQWHNGQGFSTKDRDNDSSEDTNCSRWSHGAWWYGNCYLAYSHLNGRFSKTRVDEDEYMSWTDKIKSSVMMIRPSNFKP